MKVAERPPERVFALCPKSPETRKSLIFHNLQASSLTLLAHHGLINNAEVRSDVRLDAQFEGLPRAHEPLSLRLPFPSHPAPPLNEVGNDRTSHRCSQA